MDDFYFNFAENALHALHEVPFRLRSDYEVGSIVHRGQQLGTANGNYGFGSHTHLEVIPTDKNVMDYAYTPTEGITSLPPYAFLESMLFGPDFSELSQEQVAKMQEKIKNQ